MASEVGPSFRLSPESTECRAYFYQEIVMHPLFVDKLHGIAHICYGSLPMRRRLHINGLLFLLFTLGVWSVSVFPLRREGTLLPGRVSSSPGASQILSDLDGDGLTDPALFDPKTFHQQIELYLSRTDEQVALPFDATTSSPGLLSAQDFDGDGDTDLLWRGSLPPYEVRVWLNDGTGRFECLCPQVAHDQRVAFGASGVHASHSRCSDRGLSSEEHTFVAGETLAARWNFHIIATRESYWAESTRPVSSLTRPLSTRGPPFQRC